MGIDGVLWGEGKKQHAWLVSLGTFVENERIDGQRIGRNVSVNQTVIGWQ